MYNNVRCFLWGLVLLAAAGFMLPERSAAEVSVNVAIGTPPPPVVLSSPPDVVLIRGTYVYFVPGAGTELFYYDGHWYRRHRGEWFWSRHYSGSWVYLPPARVPRVFVSLPEDYYESYYISKPVPYEKVVKKHHKKIEKEDSRHKKEKNRYEDYD
ncbi:MAG: hypothetical protein AB1553_11455 [Nitrospirota bacterium]